MKKKYKLKNPRRFIAFVSIIVIAFIGIFTICNTVYSAVKYDYIMIEVHEGDTLWTLAEKYNNKADIRKSVFEIKKCNQLKDSIIYEGMQIRIPTI